jgi:phosphoribosyl-AMP cyclohydrolase
MKKTITFFCLLAFLCFIPNAVAQCTTGGLFPEDTFTPNCNGNYQTITNQSYAGEYTNVNVIANRQYSFSSSVTTDYITITNATGTITYASGVQPVIWDSGSTTGVIRYYLHSNANCGSQQAERSRYIRCADASNCTPPSNLTVSNITSNSCKMTWTAASPVPSSNYDIYIVTTNIAPTANSTPTLFSTTNLNTTLYLNVAAGTTYYYWVRSNCGATTGVWVSGGSFTTLSALACNGAIYGLFPEATFTPACTENTEQIAANTYAGEYSNVNIVSNKQYTFTSSVATDFVTITNATGTAVLASGSTPLIWLSGTNSGVVRYHLNTNSNCGTQNTNRVKSIKCATIPCNAPTQLFYDGLTSTSNNIGWTAPNPAPSNGYVYGYSTVNNPSSPNVITGTTTNTFADLTNLSPSTTYYFWVKSNCGATQSNWVSGGSFTTTSGCNIPTQLYYDGLTATTNTIAWSTSNPAPSNGYVYCYSTVNDPFNDSAITGTTTSTFADLTNLSPSTTYYFWVKSICGNTQTDWSTGNSFTTYSTSDCNAPTQIYYDGLTATTNTIAWIEGVPTPSNGYTYCYSTVNDPFNDSAITGTTTDTYVNLTNLSPNTTYYFWVKSNCGNTQTNWASGGSFTTYPAPGCNAPTQIYYDGLTATTNTIAWIEGVPTPSNGYTYCYSTVNDPFADDVITGTTTETYANLNNLSPNTIYYFWVKSNCGNTQSNWASGGSFTTYPAADCNQPTQLFTDPESSTLVNIAWTAPNPAPSNGYIYSYSTVNDPFADDVITGTTTETFAVLNNLTSNTTYYFWVQSNCGATRSDRASGGSFTTQLLSAGSFSKKNLKLYPNPVNDILNLSFDNEITTVTIYNLVGQEVITKAVNSNETSIEVAGLAAGTYLVKLTTAEGITIDKKIIKK